MIPQISITRDGIGGPTTLTLAPHEGCLGITLRGDDATLSIGLPPADTRRALDMLAHHLAPAADPGVAARVTALRLRALGLAKASADPRGALLLLADYAEAAAVDLGLTGHVPEAALWTTAAEALREDARHQPEVPAI